MRESRESVCCRTARSDVNSCERADAPLVVTSATWSSGRRSSSRKRSRAFRVAHEAVELHVDVVDRQHDVARRQEVLRFLGRGLGRRSSPPPGRPPGGSREGVELDDRLRLPVLEDDEVVAGQVAARAPVLLRDHDVDPHDLDLLLREHRDRRRLRRLRPRRAAARRPDEEPGEQRRRRRGARGGGVSWQRVYGIRRRPSQRTVQLPSRGKPGASTSGAPSQPAAIIATAASRLLPRTAVPRIVGAACRNHGCVRGRNEAVVGLPCER